MPSHNLKTRICRLQLIRNPHPHVPVHQTRSPLGMKRNEVERHTPAVGRALVVQAMLQKTLKKRACPGAGWSRARRSAHLRAGQRRPHARNRIVVELEVLGRRPMPIIDVRLIPHFEIPGAHLLPAVAFHQVRGVSLHQLAPQLVVLGWIVRRPSHGVGRIVQLVRADPRHRRRQVLRHKAQLHHRPHARPLELIESLIGNREVVDRLAILVDPENIRRAPLELRHAVA